MTDWLTADWACTYSQTVWVGKLNFVTLIPFWDEIEVFCAIQPLGRKNDFSALSVISKNSLGACLGYTNVGIYWIYLPHIGNSYIANAKGLNITEEGAIAIRAAAQHNADLIDNHGLNLLRGREREIVRGSWKNI